MFETAELGQTIAKAVFNRAVPKLRMTFVAPPDWQQRDLFQTMKGLPKT